MTLEAYEPGDLDALALRLFDLAASVREMAHNCRAHDGAACTLHDKKALEWLGRLEEWARKSAADLRIQLIRQQATRRAEEIKSSDHK